MKRIVSNLTDEALSEENFVPQYQPIVNTITRDILGYEVLGRIYSSFKNDYLSLGSFFHGTGVNLSEKIQIDRLIREKAIKYLKASGVNTKLFFNIMPNLLSNIHKEEFLNPERFHIIQLVEKYGIDKSNIVIEITEDEFFGQTERLLRIVEIFRGYGFKIAIDDVGVGFSNLERIGYIHPDIIKVDIKIMRQSLGSASFMQVLTALSEMSLRLGSELLFEGIENEQELILAFKMGASLLQGFYFSKATSEFKSKSHFAENLKNNLEEFSGIRFLEIVDDFHRVQNIIEDLNKFFSEFSSEADLGKISPEEILSQKITNLPDNIISAFLTDLNGYQTTPSYNRKIGGDWKINFSDIGNNYAWKPYFSKHKAETYFFKKKWGVTKPLYDISGQTQYVIFTFSINENTILIARVVWDSR